MIGTAEEIDGRLIVRLVRRGWVPRRFSVPGCRRWMACRIFEVGLGRCRGKFLVMENGVSVIVESTPT